MILLSHKPRPPLDQFVERIWYCHGYTAGHSLDRMMPIGSVDLLVNLHEDQCRVYDREDVTRCRTSSGITAAGPSTEYFVIDMAEQYSVMGVKFRPGGAFPFLGPSPSELHGLHVSLEDMWGSAAADLRTQVLEAPTPDARFRALEKGLLARGRHNCDTHPAVRYALEQFHATPGPVTIAQVTGRIGLSPRRFIQIFREQVGLNPKLYCRVRRFRQVLSAVAKGGRVEWTDIALDAGYFDQAHFIHDFRSFSGINPGAYLASRPVGSHVPMA
jgi:AraC-like DNA-binding protein